MAQMADDRFWSIIDATLPQAGDPDGQLEALRSALSALSLAEIQAFETTFGAKMAAAYKWDLWGACYVIHGGASDDSFEYFRAWLIARGRKVYEAALAAPESLADGSLSAVDGIFEFEDFAFVARDVFDDLAGDEREIEPASPGEAEPAGQPFEEDPSHLAKRFPKLWAKYGDHPLG
jgi:hypothetical protein